MKSHRGYVALVAALIFSLIVIAVTFAVSLAGFLGRFNVISSYAKEESADVAEACIEVARLKFIQSSSYAGSETLTIGGNQCTIYPLTASSTQEIIKTAASVERSSTNLKVIVNAADASIASWEELSSL